MTSANPPYPYFNGITYNSQYFASSSTEGLTQAQANALYLRKTTIDSATALETFNAGIATSSIDTAAVGGTLILGGTNATTGVNIGTQSAAVNIGQAGTTLTTIHNNLNFAKNSSGINPTYIQTSSSTSSNTINFHSNNNYVTNYDSRILASGGTVVDGQGDISITSKSTNNGGTLTSTGQISANGGLLIGPSQNITLQASSFVTPTAFLQLGGTTSDTTTISAILQNASAVPTTMVFRQITTAGVYLITIAAQMTNTTAFTFFYGNVIESVTLPVINTASSGATLLNGYNYGQQLVGNVGGSNYYAINGSIVVTVTAAKINYYYMASAWVSTGGTLGSMYARLDITRIA